MRYNFTAEQLELVAHAAQGHVLITVIGCPNDMLWTELMDDGWMEPADLPRRLASASQQWNGWKMTEAGQSVFRDVNAGKSCSA